MHFLAKGCFPFHERYTRGGIMGINGTAERTRKFRTCRDISAGSVCDLTMLWKSTAQ